MSQNDEIGPREHALIRIMGRQIAGTACQIGQDAEAETDTEEGKGTKIYAEDSL